MSMIRKYHNHKQMNPMIFLKFLTNEPYDTPEVPKWDLISQNMRNKANLLDYICNSAMKSNARLPVDLKVVIGCW